MNAQIVNMCFNILKKKKLTRGLQFQLFMHIYAFMYVLLVKVIYVLCNFFYINIVLVGSLALLSPYDCNIPQNNHRLAL